MIESERLLRTCGLAKRTISRKTSYLHHTYTWVRIVGESTYVLRNYGRTAPKVPSETQCRRNEPKVAVAQHAAPGDTHSDPHSRLDDFLGLEPSQPRQDGHVNESPSGDIHLQGCEGKSDHALRFLYGISETWLSLVSQTTRLANYIERLPVDFEKLDKAFLDSLESRKKQVENIIWASTGCPSSLDQEPETGGSGRRKRQSGWQTPPAGPRAHLLEAFNHALVIFFYRRIQNIHPRVVQQLVDDVIQALRDFDSICEKESLEGPGSPWPAFIAGCEAISSDQRAFFRDWLQKSYEKTGFTRFKTTITCVQEVWRRQDEFFRNGRQDWTWVHVSKDQGIYVMLC